jgi:transposase
MHVYNEDMRPFGTAAELERRRRHAVALLQRGESPTLVARILGVSRPTLYRWKHQAETPTGLASKPHPGPSPRLSDDQVHQLDGLLRQGAKAHGWHNQLWTAARVAQLIHRHFGVSLHPDHVRRLLRVRLGWTSQKPQRKARERDEDEIARWVRDKFPRIVADTRERAAYLVFLDESGFLLTPSVRRTLAPRGETPVLDAWDRRDRLSAISCITVSPKRRRLNLYFELLPTNANVHGEDVVAFLRRLRQSLPGPLTLLWDRNQIHSRSKAVRAYLAERSEVVVEDFPGYAPELNPDEHVWGRTKYGRLANLAADDAQELWDYVVGELIGLKFRPDLLESFIQKSGLSLAA